MSLVGKIRVACPACGTEHECELVQSINTETSPALRERLLRNELNLLSCPCGKRVQLAGNLLFHDPAKQFLCQVCPGGDAAVTAAIAAFRDSGATGTLRIVPSQNALIEKVRILDAGLEDWAIEVAKVLLLAALGIRDTNRIVLFEKVDPERLHWVMLENGAAQTYTSPRVSHDNIVAKRGATRPAAGELQIDRVWAVDSLRKTLPTPN